MKGRQLEGIVTAPITPLDEKGNPHPEAIERLVEILIKKGIHGFFIIGSTGEFPLLEIETRKKVAEIYKKAIGDQVPLVVHIGDTRIEDAMELASHAASLGVDGISSVAPYYYKYDDESLFHFFSTLARIDPELPFYIYNFPANTGNDISPLFLKRLYQENRNILGIKDTSQNYLTFIDYVNIMGPDYGNLIGSDAMILGALVIGGKGVVSAGSTSFPEPFLLMYEAYLKGNQKEAARLQLLAAKLKNLFGGPTFLASRKIALQLRGFNYPELRRPLRPMGEKEIHNFQRKVRELEEEFQFPLAAKFD